MSTITPEPGIGKWVDTPPYDASVFSAGYPWDSGTWDLIVSNLEVLCRESCRHHVWDPVSRSVGTDGDKSTWTGVQDLTKPSDADIAALPSDEKYKGVSWVGSSTVPYGPFPLVADRQDSVGRAVCRKLRCRVTLNNSDTGTTKLHAVVTTHPDPVRISQGDIAAPAVYHDMTGTGAQTYTFDFSPDVEDLPREPGGIPSRSGTSTSGATRWQGTLFWVWICVDSRASLCLLTSVSIFEQRD